MLLASNLFQIEIRATAIGGFSNWGALTHLSIQCQSHSALEIPKLHAQLNRSAMNSLKMCQPWHKFVNTGQPNRILILRKQNYNMNTNTSLTLLSSHLVVTVIDTKAVPNFIQSDFLEYPFYVTFHVNLLGTYVMAKITNRKCLAPLEYLYSLKATWIIVSLLFCKTLLAPAVLGFSICGRFVGVIFPIKWMSEVNNEWTVLVIRRPLNLFSRRIQAILSVGLDDTSPASSLTPGIKSAKALTAPPRSQSWVKTTTERHGLLEQQSSFRQYLNLV